MNRTRNGRIARLPREIREELNRRLDEGEEGRSLVTWLNQLPEVIARNEAEHEGKSIRPQNLSEWRKGGYQDWIARQQIIEIAGSLSEEAATWESEGRAPLADTLAHWVAGRYALATREMTTADGSDAWESLRGFCRDLVELRKGDHSAQRLRLERERLQWERERDQQRLDEQFWEWAAQPENRDRICRGYKTPGAQAQILRKLFFGDTEASERPPSSEKTAATAHVELGEEAG